MLKKLKRYAALGTILVQLISFTAVSFAESLEDKLSDIQLRMEEEQNKASEAQVKIDNISESLRIIQERLNNANREYRAVKQQLDDTEAKLEENQEALETAEATLEKRMRILNKRLRDIYVNGQINYLDVLFGARDFNDLMTRMELLKRLIKHDYDLIMDVKNQRRIILEKKAELEQNKRDIEVLEKSAREKRDEIDKARAEEQEILDQVTYDRDMAEQAYQELQAASREVEQMIRQSRYRVSAGSGGGQSTGTMIWPISGPITSEYGWRTHPIFGTSKYHSGLDIGGDYGDNVLAADGGVVIYAGWISGYGNTVIIDHGGGVSSLYGHNDSLTVSDGESVSQGQTIAYCGSTGNSTGPHVHFEVRQNGEPVSPYNYL